MAATFTIPSVFTAVDKFSGVMKGMGNAVNGFVGRSERALLRANALFAGLMKPITGLNKMLMGLGYYVGLFTLVRIIKNAIDIFADFEQANKNLALVMGVTVQQNRVLAADARRIGLAYGEAATDVVKMQHALATLGFEQKDILAMGKPLITGSSALEGANPERLAEITGALINAFQNPGIALGVQDTQHILDVMTLASNRTALTFEKLATTLPIVAGPANAANISFEETVALLGILANAGVHVATSGTSLKNIFIDSAKKGHTYNQVIENIIKNSDKLVYANKQFGKRSVVSALAIAQKMHDAKNGVIALTDEFKNAKIGLTELIAAERINTFRGAQKLLNAAWQEFVLSIEDGNGALAKTLTKTLRVASAILLLSSDSDQAREAISKMDAGIVETARKWQFWIKLVGYATLAIIAMKTALIVWRAVTVAATIAQGAFSIAMGITTAAGWTNVMMLRGNAIAMGTLRLITGIATAAQWAFNLAMDANPIMLVITAVLGLAAAFGILDSSYNKVNGSMNKWQEIMKGSGVQNVTPNASDKVNYWLQKFMVDEDYARKNLIKHVQSYPEEYKRENTVPVNPKLDYNQAQADSLMNALNAKIQLNINDPGGHVKDVSSDSSSVMPKVTTTNSFQ